MSTVPRLPEPLTEDGLRDLMRQRAYWDLKHPQSSLYRRLVETGFSFLYPGPGKLDGVGRMIRPDPRPPGEVAPLVAKVNREMDQLERVLDGEAARGGGEVHVQSHTRDGGKTEVADYWRARPGEESGNQDTRDTSGEPVDENRSESAPENALPIPDSREPVDPEDFYRKVEFDPNGEKQWQAAFRRPLDADRASDLAKEAHQTTRNEYPHASGLNDEADAFRHAYWSFQMTREIGSDAAKAFGDAHERSDQNPTPERLMDLYNNKAGRDLATDPNNANRDGREVIREAIRHGKLRIRPFETNEPRFPFPDQAPGLFFRPSGGQGR